MMAVSEVREVGLKATHSLFPNLHSSPRHLLLVGFQRLFQERPLIVGNPELVDIELGLDGRDG